MIGELSALGTAFCWSGSSIAFAEATVRIGSMRVNVTRLLLAASLLALTLLTFAIPYSISASQLINLAISGFFGLVFGDTFLFKSYEYVGARVSSLVMSTAPAITAILAYVFLHESLSAAGLVGMTVTLLGIGLVVSGRRESSSVRTTFRGRGIFFAFLGACGQGAGLVTAKLAFDEGAMNGLTATFIRIVAALVFLVPIAYMSGRYEHPWRIYGDSKKAFLLTLLGAVLGPYLGITLSLISISHTKVAIAATIMATVPILMLPLIKLVYKESLNWRIYCGTFIAVAGVAVLFLR